MRCAIVVFCAGIASAVCIVDVGYFLPLCLILLFVVGLSAAVLLAIGLPGLKPVARLLLFLAIFLLGLIWHLHWASLRLQAMLPSVLEGATLRVEGIVLGLPERTPIAQQFQFRVLQAAAGFYPRTIALNYYGEHRIEPGQLWRFSVRLNRPHGFANPGGFDYEAWLMQRGVSARGYVRPSAGNRLLAPGESVSYTGVRARLDGLRFHIRASLDRLSAGAAHAGLLNALVLGDRSAISQESWSLFTATGSNHLFVISGLHIGLISGFSYFLSLQLGRALGLGRGLPAQKCAAALALLAAFCYALLAGFTLPTQRAFIMLAVLISGLFWNTRYLISFRLLAALLMVLLLNPLAVTSSGFWLSFVAVTALLAFAGEPAVASGEGPIDGAHARAARRLTLRYVKPQLVVMAALTVPLIVFTGQVSLLAPLVNIVAIPVVGLLIVPLCFFALGASLVSEATAAALLGVAHFGIGLLIGFMEALAGWGAGALQLEFSQPGVIQQIALSLASLLLLLPRGVCPRVLLLPLLSIWLPLARDSTSTLSGNDALQLHIVDVGQGLALVVRTQEHNLLFDSGANLSPDFNIGSAVVAPALRALGVRRLDAVVISHGDNDHAGGLAGVRQHLQIDRLISNAPRADGAEEMSLCENSEDWSWDGVDFRFLRTGLEFSGENNDSCVLQIRYGGVGILLPGDIEREAERALVLRYGDELRSTILLAPHHGSLSSSSYGFLKRVRPDYVVFSAGYRNSFGHPHARIRARYDEFDSLQLTTWATGMISFHFDAGQIEAGRLTKPLLYREQIRRYWR